MDYFSSPDCDIYINGLLAEEVVLVSVNENTPKMPVYGWRNRKFIAVASGESLVSGSIIVNCTHHDYLDALLYGMDPGSATGADPIQNIKDRVSQTLTQLQKIGGTTITPQLIAAARANRMLNLGKGDTRASSLSDITRGSRDFATTITIRTPNDDVNIKEVHFSGMGTQVDGTRSDNIKYAYSFIAKEIV